MVRSGGPLVGPFLSFFGGVRPLMFGNVRRHSEEQRSDTIPNRPDTIPTRREEQRVPTPPTAKNEGVDPSPPSPVPAAIAPACMAPIAPAPASMYVGARPLMFGNVRRYSEGSDPHLRPKGRGEGQGSDPSSPPRKKTRQDGSKPPRIALRSGGRASPRRTKVWPFAVPAPRFENLLPIL